MATAKTQATESQENGSLMDFNFDNDNEFFGVKADDNDGQATIKEVKSSGGSAIMNDDEDDMGGTTNLEDDPSRNKAKTIKTTTKTEAPPSSKTEGKQTPKSKAGKQDDDEVTDDEEEPEFTFTEPQKEKPKVKAKAEEDETTDEEEETATNKDKDGKEGKTGKEKAKTEQGKEGKKDENEEVTDDEFYTTLASELKEKGIFQNVTIKEDEPITEERFFELQDEEIEARVNETFEAFFQELDDDGKAFLKFKKNGGKTEDFLTHYASNFDVAELDESNPAHINKTVMHYLTNYENLDGEELDDRLKYIKESGKEKAYASKWFAVIKKDEKDAADLIQKQQDKAAKQREDNVKAFNSSLSATLKKTEKVGVFPISKNEQRELGDYITKPTVKVGKNKYVPPFQVELAAILRGDTPESREALILLSKLVRDKFDIGDLAKNVQTEVVKKAKSKLRDSRDTNRPSTSGQYSKRSMADYFDEE